MHETMQSAGRLADETNNCPHMEGEMRCERSGKYIGITMLSHIMNLLERRIVDKRLRERVEHVLGEEQQGFRKE